jgi:hypothetical protein
MLIGIQHFPSKIELSSLIPECPPASYMSTFFYNFKMVTKMERPEKISFKRSLSPLRGSHNNEHHNMGNEYLTTAKPYLNPSQLFD